MTKELNILKGIHPGIYLQRELKKRNIPGGRFALSINEYPQTLSAILKGKRNMNVPLAMRIEEALNMEEGFLMMLQVFYDIKEEKHKYSKTNHPDISLFRPSVFWDTQLQKIDWVRNSAFVIKRIFERGNLREKKEIVRFYGTRKTREILNRQANAG